MILIKKMTPENFKDFIGLPKNIWFDSYAVLVQDGGTEVWPKGRRTIYMVTRQGDEFAVINEHGKVKLTGRSIGELVTFHSNAYTFFYIEIKP